MMTAVRRLMLLAAMGTLLLGCPSADQTKPDTQVQRAGPAEVFARSDDLTLKLTIVMLDGTEVLIGETQMVKIEPGRHEVMVRAQGRPSPFSALTGLGFVSALAHKADPYDKQTSVAFEAEPGRRYMVNAANEGGRLRVWVVDDETGRKVSP